MILEQLDRVDVAQLEADLEEAVEGLPPSVGRLSDDDRFDEDPPILRGSPARDRFAIT